jgi:hypothetical protein
VLRDRTYGGGGGQVAVRRIGVPNPEAAAAITFRTVDGTISIPPQFHGHLTSVAVYDLGGKLIKQSLVKQNVINLKKDLGLAGGVYVVRVKKGF